MKIDKALQLIYSGVNLGINFNKKINFKGLLKNTLVIDGTIKKSTNIETSQNFIRVKNLLENEANLLISSLENIKKGNDTTLPQTNNLYFKKNIIELINSNDWCDIYGTSTKKINISIGTNFELIDNLKVISFILENILTKNIFLAYNMSRGFIFINILLNFLGLPSIYIIKNRKKFLNSIGKEDFFENFLNLLVSNINKEIAQEIAPDSIAPLMNNQYINPAYTFYDENTGKKMYIKTPIL